MSATLVLGGARSGKSGFAQREAEASGFDLLLVATGEALDDEMAARIARHRADRDARWTTREEPLDLAAMLRKSAAPGRALLVDCLTLWLSNLMQAGRDPEPEGAALARLVPTLPGAVWLVSNEVGLGLVPQTALGRAFRDAQGRLNQSLAQACPRVVFVAAGLPLILKNETPPAAPPYDWTARER